jgi:glyoxylase-like metal-dependent hydrolase (beta-lactamase superfamily II)
MNAICITCGTQFSDSADHPRSCPICTDERQYVGFHGQQWTTLEDLRRDYRTTIQNEEPGLTSFAIEPKFGIGQRAFLVETNAGNVLWDCISLLDAGALEEIAKLGSPSAIAISHPHYYTSMVEWSRVFGDVPIYLHAADAKWVMRPDKNVRFWEGEAHELPGGLRLVRCGGHFEGATVLHWPEGASGKGVLLTGDTIQVVPDRRWVSFMYSYPNYVPLNESAVQRIFSAAVRLTFDRIYGAFPGLTVEDGGKQALIRSAARYLNAIR